MVAKVNVKISGEERREAIVSAAVKLFSRKGFANTTMRQIATAAGVAEGTIYRYFDSKQEILFAFIEPAALQGFASYFSFDSDDDDQSLISAFILSRLQNFRINRHLMRVVIGEALHNPLLAEGLRAMLLPAFSELEGYFSRRINAGVFRQLDAGLAARALIGHVMGYFIQSTLFLTQDDEEDMVLIADELARIYLQGLTANIKG